MTTPTPGARLDAMRAARPLVHNITNYVAANFVANALLAAGAVPAMAHAPEEAGDLARRADSLAINIGTLSRERVTGILAAVEAARAASRPWVLDPVAVGGTAHRAGVAERLVDLHPTVTRGNAAEILALAGGAAAGRGPDAAGLSEGAAEAARDLAHRTGAVVAVTGATDYVTDGVRALSVANGHPVMGRVTAMGCGLTAMIAAFLSGADDPLEATGGAIAFYGHAGELAAEGAAGPGSFAVSFLDKLSSLDATRLDQAARITPMPSGKPAPRNARK